ncbi:methyltransferase domain-containing protein [Sulfurimonas sp. SAG-AH-194-L11]|nr:methyltransferase domain-containing protein [Sulfurimonas sp. SAG-AH-194-L11]MDF1877701.1 methyltransferase domain-containing protein [Sulfurimonas sp. SAG-AH-194-L11]
MQEHNKASAWFEELYKQNENTHENIPWAKLTVNPLLQTYLDTKKEHKGKALVIGCGLGDDAYALSKAGYETLAIDISQTALDIAEKRFVGTAIVYEKQDIFDMPKKYFEYFDFVFEALTIQSLPREFREKMIKAVADSVAKNGELLVVAHKKELVDGGPPWPLTQVEIDHFKSNGVQQMSFELIKEASHISNTRFRILYKKMA